VLHICADNAQMFTVGIDTILTKRFFFVKGVLIEILLFWGNFKVRGPKK
jgi:hypothetical protein